MIPPPSAVSPERTLQTAMLRVGLGSSSAVDACYAAVPRYATHPDSRQEGDFG